MSDAAVPKTCLPDWGVADLPEPRALSRHWTSFIGPGIVMCGIQIGGGEWLFGPEVTAKYGGGLMWIATVAIVLQVFEVATPKGHDGLPARLVATIRGQLVGKTRALQSFLSSQNR